MVLPPGGSTKAETLKAAGLTTQSASRCEKIAEIPEAEIKTRASRRIGEISRELEKAKPAGGKGKVVRPPSGLTKVETLAAAGLTKQSAHRCETIAAIPEAEFEAFLAERKAAQQPVSAKELLAYARQTNDHELETWTAEIKTRASRRIGEISRELEKAHGTGKAGKIKLPPSGSLKAGTLKAAGLTVQSAHRCERIAEIPEAEFEAFLAERKAAGEAALADDA